jgi:hypothetical protein
LITILINQKINLGDENRVYVTFKKKLKNLYNMIIYVIYKMLELSDFTYCELTIIIHPNVNKFIDFNLINEDFNKIIFSDYENIEIIETNIKTYNLYDNEHKEYWESHFNQPIVLTNNLTHLSFGHKFNQPIILTNNLTHLTFGDGFNRPIILTNNLTHLTFGYVFNQPIILTNNLTHLTFGNKFNQPIELANIKYLNINCDSIHLIENLPNSLKKLVLDYNFNLPLDNLPNSIEIIELDKNYNKPFKNIPKNLKLIKCWSRYKHLNLLKELKNNLDFQIETFG